MKPIRHLFTITCAAALAACGGGGLGGNGAPDLAPADSQARAGILTYCGIDDPIKSGRNQGDGGFAFIPQTDWSGGPLESWSKVVAWGNTTDADEALLPLTTLFDDHRERSEPPMGRAVPGEVYYMGILISSYLADGSAACVSSVSRYDSVYAWDLQTGWGYKTVFNWSGIDLRRVSFVGLKGTPIDGFHFLSNFEARNGTAVFSVRKTDVADASATEICHTTGTGSGWNCVAPTVTDLGEGWRLKAPAHKSGVYMLMSSKAGRGA